MSLVLQIYVRNYGNMTVNYTDSMKRQRRDELLVQYCLIGILLSAHPEQSLTSDFHQVDKETECVSRCKRERKKMAVDKSRDNP